MSSASVTASEPQAKASIYAFLAEVFSSSPTPDSVRGVRQMAEALGIPCSDEPSLSDLDREYMKLFVVPNPRYVAPYESVFCDRWLVPAAPREGAGRGASSLMIKGLVMGESTLGVRECYLEVGVLPSEGLPDHIGTELRFMAHLWACEAEKSPVEAEVLPELRAKFRNQHILKWIGQLRERVAESAHLGYYPAALQIAEAVLRDDA
jgi:TorA maturation chaperone TorD